MSLFNAVGLSTFCLGVSPSGEWMNSKCRVMLGNSFTASASCDPGEG